MKNYITHYVSFLILKEKSRWYAHNYVHGKLGGTNLKRELIEFMEEQYNADVVGEYIWVPKKSLKI